MCAGVEEREGGKFTMGWGGGLQNMGENYVTIILKCINYVSCHCSGLVTPFLQEVEFAIRTVSLFVQYSMLLFFIGCNIKGVMGLF